MKIINFSQYKSAKQLCSNNIDTEQIAKEILEQHNMHSIPVDPVVIAKNEGIKVIEAEFKDNNLSGLISKCNDSTIILVNAKEVYRRKRSIIAHELGHFYMHLNNSNCEEIVDRYREDKLTQEEVEANNFADALLMPVELLEDTFKKLKDMNVSENKLIELLAKIFQVSKGTMIIRLQNLGLIYG